MAVRTEVGWLPLCRVPRWRHGRARPAGTSGRSPATSPVSSPRCSAASPNVAWSTANSSSRVRSASTSTRCSSASIPPPRACRLAGETPAALIAFDLLAVGDRDLRGEPLGERRRLLLETVTADPLIHLGPSTDDVALAATWFDRFEGAGLDGIVAKRLDGPYTPGERTMIRVKPPAHRGLRGCRLRWHKDGNGIGSLLLGLYDGDGALHHVGASRQLHGAGSPQLVGELEPMRAGALDDHSVEGVRADAMAHATSQGRMPGSPSRWNAQKDMSWEPLRVERVCEVTFTQLTNGRFRHNAQFVRWRPDREPRSCTYDQLEVAEAVEFDALFR